MNAFLLNGYIEPHWNLFSKEYRIYWNSFVSGETWGLNVSWKYYHRTGSLSFSGADSNFTCQILLLLQLLFEFLQFGHWMVWRNGHSRNLGQTTGWGPGNGRVPTVQEELSVINDPSSWRRDRTYIIATNHMARKTYLHSRLQTITCEKTTNLGFK